MPHGGKSHSKDRCYRPEADSEYLIDCSSYVLLLRPTTWLPPLDILVSRLGVGAYSQLYPPLFRTSQTGCCLNPHCLQCWHISRELLSHRHEQFGSKLTHYSQGELATFVSVVIDGENCGYSHCSHTTSDSGRGFIRYVHGPA